MKVFFIFFVLCVCYDMLWVSIDCADGVCICMRKQGRLIIRTFVAAHRVYLICLSLFFFLSVSLSLSLFSHPLLLQAHQKVREIVGGKFPSPPACLHLCSCPLSTLFKTPLIAVAKVTNPVCGFDRRSRCLHISWSSSPPPLPEGRVLAWYACVLFFSVVSVRCGPGLLQGWF